MIEFIERFRPDGGMSARVKADGLPPEMYYRVTYWPDGKVTAQSKAYGKGSIRYYTHPTYIEALAHGYRWAQRKVAEAKLEQQKSTHEKPVE
jgi:hypothetical protein